MPLGPGSYDSLLRSSPIKSVIKIVAAAVGIFRTHVFNGGQLLRTQFAAKNICEANSLRSVHV